MKRLTSVDEFVHMRMSGSFRVYSIRNPHPSGYSIAHPVYLHERAHQLKIPLPHRRSQQFHIYPSAGTSVSGFESATDYVV